MMAKLIFHFLSVMSMILPSASRSWSPPSCACATSNVNIRSGPGLSYKILGVLKTSSCLEYIHLDEFSDNLSWSGVLYNHQRAWVAKEYTRLDCTSNSNQCVCAKSDVNIRSGPGLHNSIVGSMNIGACQRAGQEILTGYGKWTSVTYNGGGAFIASEFLDRRDCSRVLPPVPNICVCATGNVNILSGPGLNHGSLGVLHTGLCEIYYGHEASLGNQEWANVQYNGKAAYIASSHLKLQTCDNVQPQIHENCVCARSNVNIRSGPALYYRILGVLHTGSCQGAGQEISTGNGRWTSVSYNGQSAYIASQFLYRQSCNQPNPKLNENCVCARSNVNIRSGPALFYRILGVLHTGSCQGAGQEISTGNGRWTSVSYNGQSAYIASQFLYRQSCNPKPTLTGQCVCGLTNVKVQSSPSLSSTVLGTLQSGGCLPYIGQLNGQGYSRWVKVKVDLTNAYILADYVTRGPCSPSANTRWLD